MTFFETTLLVTDWRLGTTSRRKLVNPVRKFYLLLTGQVKQLSKEIDDEHL
jgi:hypothetical protein